MCECVSSLCCVLCVVRVRCLSFSGCSVLCAVCCVLCDVCCVLCLLCVCLLFIEICGHVDMCVYLLFIEIYGHVDMWTCVHVPPSTSESASLSLFTFHLLTDCLFAVCVLNVCCNAILGVNISCAVRSVSVCFVSVCVCLCAVCVLCVLCLLCVCVLCVECHKFGQQDGLDIECVIMKPRTTLYSRRPTNLRHYFCFFYS